MYDAPLVAMVNCHEHLLHNIIGVGLVQWHLQVVHDVSHVFVHELADVTDVVTIFVESIATLDIPVGAKLIHQ